MITIQKLQSFGADTEEGLNRCCKMEPLYLKLVGQVAGDNNFDILRKPLEDGDLDAAFESAHALKGVTGNLSLTPLYKPVSELTELLRERNPDGSAELLDVIITKRGELDALCSG